MNEKKNRNDRKTLPFPWEYGQEEITLKVSSYAYGNGLAILMYCQEEGELELFDDLTVNLPGGYSLEPQEAFISGDFTKDKLAFIEKNRLGNRLPGAGGMYRTSALKTAPNAHNKEDYNYGRDRKEASEDCGNRPS